MILINPQMSGIPGLNSPDVLVFLRIPKTAGLLSKRCLNGVLPAGAFNAYIQVPECALLIRQTSEITEKFRQLPPDRQKAVRCLVDTHVALDVETVFDRPVRFFTVLREPVDRVISNFFHNRASDHLPCYRFIRDMTIENYLDSGIGLDADNHQVRVLSGCADLDRPWDSQGRALKALPVERRHLELAKRNIEERFIVAAPLEKVAALIWFFKRLYNWPLHLSFFNKLNEAAESGRPTVDTVSAETRHRLRQLNKFDAELYQWVQARFAEKIAPLEPTFSRELRRFEQLNEIIRQIDRNLPKFVAKTAKRRFYSAQRTLL